ncbi:MAG: ferrous iron transport protein B [Bacteroides sp.]|nr:ferrous iron transport protein B [Bacteroides sp.]MCM1379136.1 ferrous iron transport protein B [Bacteroides sp.]MCM1445330.1 ferrous iron transport protein B [Prevotella sp.]
MRLSELRDGQAAYVVKILGRGAFRKRLTEMGFVRGKKVTKVLCAPMNDPVKYSLLGYEVSLRRSEAELVEVIEAAEGVVPEIPDANTRLAENEDDELLPALERRSHTINIALIGNPNCGKTSMFNSLSGATEHVGNYSGVTVEAKKGHFEYGGYHFNVVDLPGTYSLAAYSPEELYVRRYLASETPDVIVNVVVASNLERNLYLTTELIDMDRSMVVALNMYDEIEESGQKLDYELLGAMVGVPMVPTVSKTGRGMHELLDTIIRVYEGREESVRHVHITLGEDIQQALTPIKDIIKADTSIPPKFAARYLALKFLEGDEEVESQLRDKPYYPQLHELRERGQKLIETRMNEDVTSAIAAEKYGFIDGALAETMSGERLSSTSTTSVIDAFVTNRLFGIPLFLGIMFCIFWLTFSVGQYPMDWIESGVEWLGQLVQTYFPAGPLKDLLADGVIGGVGSVIVFLPNILILYACISFMEDSGYMARAAFIMDRSMHRIGLHGKSFIPLLMGFGCNVPAIMATRAIESRSSRLITIMINPFMSCSARLPIYLLLIGTFFSSHAALVFFCLYALGVCMAMLTARLLRRFVWTKDETPFVMELPPYRVPTAKAVVRHTWAKGKQYLQKMGGIILVACIVVWALNYFPQKTDQNPEQDSYLEMLGKAVNPVMEPIGMHWRATVAAIAGVPAKEIVVSTLGVLYTGSEEVTESALSERLTAPQPATGQPDFTPASALAFLVFILLYCPCIATLVAITKESGSWKYGAFSAVYNTLLAWLVAFAVYRIALLF